MEARAILKTRQNLKHEREEKTLKILSKIFPRSGSEKLEGLSIDVRTTIESETEVSRGSSKGAHVFGQCSRSACNLIRGEESPDLF